MIGSSQYNLTWSHFAQLHDDKRTAFENLCRSLFQRKLCKEGSILHSDPNHPGVEVTPVTSKDGKSIVSFQAKYFDNAIGYDQIKKSANQAVDHYMGHLDQIYLYCNKDITATSKSYTDIEKMLKALGIELILVTGQTILDQAADYPTVLACYFGLDCLDDNWFAKNLQLSLDNLGKRYNSLFNVDTDAQRSLSIFLREAAGISAINKKKTTLLEELENLRWRCSGKYKQSIGALSEAVKSMSDICAETICDALTWEDELKEKCKDFFEGLHSSVNTVNAEMEKSQTKDSKYEELRNEAFVIDRLMSSPEHLGLTRQEQSFVKNRVLLVTGEMGTGKSQLLATAAKRMLACKRPTLLLLGQIYISDESIETQIMNGFDGLDSRESFESMLAVMNEKGFVGKGDAVVFIDAINESRNRDIWKTGINRLLSIFEQYKNVRLVISLRTGFEGLTLSEKIETDRENGNIASIVHYGFADDSPSSVYEFLSNCGIPFSPEYYLQSEMTNPLFLTWFCQTYTGEEQGLISLIEKVIEQSDMEGSKEAGYNEPVGMLKSLFYDIIDITGQQAITKPVLLKLPTWATYGITNKIPYIKAIERSGVLTSYVRNLEEIYYIGFNLLEDFLQASRIMDREKEKEKIREYCKKQLLGIDENGSITNYGNETIFTMLSSLYAIRFGDECIDIVDEVADDWGKRRIIDLYYETFAWRSSYISYDNFFSLIQEYPIEPKRVWNVFIENATKEQSELNAEGLTKLLSRYELNYRDYIWTTEINELTEYDRIVSLAYFIEEGNEFQDLSEKKAFLLLTLFTWMLASSNRVLRDRVSKAMIEILKSKFMICKPLLEHFKDINDPYIIQRLYGNVFGAVMKRNGEYKDDFVELVTWIYREIFMKEYVYPDILLRDYARLIVERFAYEYPTENYTIDMTKVRPPYKSEPIPKVEEVDYTVEKYQETGMWRLLHSMKFDIKVKGVGSYGDFGRYTFQSALNNFVGVDVANVYYYAIGYILDKLGYTNEYFGEYDSHKANFDRHHVKRIERIGKKYQWITMYNILARLSDFCKIRGWNWNDKVGVAYNGPWEPYVRDFDPTLNMHHKLDAEIPKINLPKYGDEGFLPFDASGTDIDKWVQMDDILFRDFPSRLIHKDEYGKEWISMYLYQENKIQPPNAEISIMGFPNGEQHIWSLASLYMTFDRDSDITQGMLKSSGFIHRNKSNVSDCYSLFSREYAWSPGYKAEFEDVDVDEDDEGCGSSINAVSATINVLWEEEYDASQDEVTSFMIPAGRIIKELELYEKNSDGIYYYRDEIAAFDLSVIGHEHKELIIRRDVLNEYIEKSGAKLFWTVIGEKQYFLGTHNQKWQRREGYFIYGKRNIEGEIYIADNT